MKKIAALLALALLGACSSKNTAIDDGANDANLVSFNTFEGMAGWGGIDANLLDKGRAHSGQYAIKVDKDHEFSLTFDMPLGQVSTRKFKTVHLSAWAFMPNEHATGVFGLQIMEPDNNKQTFGDGIKLGEVNKTYNKWVPISKDITLPDDITPVQHLRLSLWRADASDYVLLDDVKVSVD